MILWIDAQLSPRLATWMAAEFGVEAHALRDLGLRDARDREIFAQAKQAGVVVMTKDADFVRLLEELGAPPRILWITVGNTSNARLQQILLESWGRIVQLFEAGEILVEIQSLKPE